MSILGDQISQGLTAYNNPLTPELWGFAETLFGGQQWQQANPQVQDWVQQWMPEAALTWVKANRPTSNTSMEAIWAAYADWCLATNHSVANGDPCAAFVAARWNTTPDSGGGVSPAGSKLSALSPWYWPWDKDAWKLAAWWTIGIWFVAAALILYFLYRMFGGGRRRRRSGRRKSKRSRSRSRSSNRGGYSRNG